MASSEARDTWLIEITGGPGTDCAGKAVDDCPDYTYDNITDRYVPALLNKVLNETNKTKLQYVGFSNGCRSALSSLEKGSFDPAKVDTFVDGVAVKTVGVHTFAIAKHIIDTMLLVPEGKVCQEMISLYQNDGLVTEPAGALSVAGLEQMKDKIKGKVVVCIVSGGNNDISRYTEVIERSLVYQGLKHYFVIEFSQRPGGLPPHLHDVLRPPPDITLLLFFKKKKT